MKKCPQCAEEIQDEAKICRFCSFAFEISPVQVFEDRKVKILDAAINAYVVKGWILMSRTENLAQLGKPKKFNWGWFLFWLFIGVVAIELPLFIYIIYYAVKKDEVVTLSVANDGALITNGYRPPAPAVPLTPKEQAIADAKAKASTRTMLIILGIAVVVIITIVACIILAAIVSNYGNTPTVLIPLL